MKQRRYLPNNNYFIHYNVLIAKVCYIGLQMIEHYDLSMYNASKIIVHFKRLGSWCFYDLFERSYFFFSNRYASSKTKP